MTELLHKGFFEEFPELGYSDFDTFKQDYLSKKLKIGWFFMNQNLALKSTNDSSVISKYDLMKIILNLPILGFIGLFVWGIYSSKYWLLLSPIIYGISLSMIPSGIWAKFRYLFYFSVVYVIYLSTGERELSQSQFNLIYFTLSTVLVGESQGIMNLICTKHAISSEKMLAHYFKSGSMIIGKGEKIFTSETIILSRKAVE